MWTRASIALLLLSLAAPSFAQRLPLAAVPEHYDLAFDVQLAEARFDGVETLRVRVPAETTSIALHAVDIALHEVQVAGQRATVSTSPEMQLAHFRVDRPIPVGVHEIRIRYSGTLNDRLRGFYLSQADGRRYAVTQLEPTDARRAFPSFDEPALKATFAVTVTIDRGDTAISNGRVVSDTPGPGAGRHTLKFSTTAKMSTYLVAIAVGDFQCLETSADNIPIRICATPGKKTLGRIALESSREILRFLNRYHTIKYPFGKLDVVAVPDFAAGAMENTAAIFYRESSLLAGKDASVTTRKNIANTLAHEIAHMWFGDLVTMKWWDDLWLNEGIATWMANRPLAAWKPEWRVDVDEALETQRALALDSLAPDVASKLTPPERVSLLGDEWALVQTGRHQVGEYLTLVSGLRGERTSGILTELNARLRVIHSHLTTAASRPAFEAFVRNLARPTIDELGTAAKRGDTDERRAARAAAISSLGHMGNDRDMASQARSALEAALAGRQRLDATAADAIVGVAAAHGDRALHDALLKAAEAAAAPEDRYRYLYALAQFTDPALVERGLEHARTPAMRGQDTAGYLNRFLTNPAINHRAWRFVKAHWTELEPKVVVAFGDVTLVHALGSFCDASTRDDIRQFFAGSTIPAATRTLDQTLERITNCTALKTAQTSALTDWLADRR